MNPNFKRPKTLFTKSFDVVTQCGKLHVFFNYLDKDMTQLVEVMANIGKSGVCQYILIDTVCKLLSIILQSPLSRKKIIKKLRRGFIGTDKTNSISCGNPFVHEEKEYTCCVELIVKKIEKELNR